MTQTVAPVDVVTIAAPGEKASIMIDPCLDAFRVGRVSTLNEMLLPGYNTADDADIAGLKPAAALVHQLVRKCEHNEPVRELITFLKDGGYVASNGAISPEGLEAAREIKTAIQVKDKTTGFYRRIEAELLAVALKRSGMAIVRRTDGTFLNPNVVFLSDEEMTARLNVSSIVGYSFFVPSPVAEGSLLPCTSDDGKQSTKLRVALPEGFHLLEGWLKSNNRVEALQFNKWGDADA